MNGRLKGLGAMLVIIGIAFVAAGGYAFIKTPGGREVAPGVQRGPERQAQLQRSGPARRPRRHREARRRSCRCSPTTGAIAVNTADLNPNDPLVNTASEYMYQMATISYHTLHGTQTVVLPEDVTAADGTVYKAGTYEFPVDGRYWTGFDRTNPIEAAAREQALDRHGTRADRRARRRHRHRLDPPDGPRPRRPLRRPRRDDHPDRPRPVWAAGPRATEKAPAFRTAPIPA